MYQLHIFQILALEGILLVYLYYYNELLEKFSGLNFREFGDFWRIRKF